MITVGQQAPEFELDDENGKRCHVGRLSRANANEKQRR